MSYVRGSGARCQRRHRAGAPAIGLLAAALVLSACNAPAATSSSKLRAVGAENQYANVIAQIGGRFVSVEAVVSNPNTDPHSFETSTSDAQEIASAQLIVQNGVGYDTFMQQLESSAPSASRRVIVVQKLLGLSSTTRNPHLWYDPKTMPAVAAVMSADLSALDPSHAAYFRARLAAFDASLRPWLAAIAGFRAAEGGTPVATTEPVADYLLQAMGMKNLTPYGFQADIMNGVDPSPEGISLEDGFFSRHRVKVFCYNQQVVDSLTMAIKADAVAAGIPVVGVYETMPTPGFDYQTWMLAEVAALRAAVVHGVSTEHL